jgi:futalosine hydrolase
MLKSILFVAATAFEAGAVEKLPCLRTVSGRLRSDGTDVSILVAGVGAASTSWKLHKWIFSNPRPDIIINIGIAGSYREDIAIGDVVMPVTDCFADSGIEDGSNFLTLFESGLDDPDEFPYNHGMICADPEISGRMSGILRPVRAITVNTATGSDHTRDRLVRKYEPDIETMEGATFFYLCKREKIPFMAVRSVSNIVETRNRDRWNINLALASLTGKLNDVVQTLEK